MFRLQAHIQFRRIGDNALTQTSHRAGERHHHHAANQVVKDVEIDHQFRIRKRQPLHRVRQHMHKWQDQQTAYQLKQQAPQRHATRIRGCGTVIDHRQDAGTQVSANHKAKRHVKRDDACRGKRGGKQHGGKAGITDHRKHRANERIQQDIAGQRGENDFDA